MLNGAMQVLLLLAVLAVTWQPVLSTLMEASVVYSDTNCQGTPIYTILEVNENCTSDRALCTANADEISTQYESTSCVDIDRHEFVASVFGGFPYVMMDVYEEMGCETLQYANAFLAAGICERSGSGNRSISSIARLNENGSAMMVLFGDTHCGTETAEAYPTASEIDNHECFGGEIIKFYSSVSPTDNSNSSSISSGSSSSSGGSLLDGSVSTIAEIAEPSTGLGTAGIAGIVVGSIVFVGLLVAAFMWARRSKSKRWVPSEEIESPVDPQRDDSKLNPSYMSETERETMADVHVPRGSGAPYRENSSLNGLWDDEAIVAVRIPRNKVFVHDLISRDAYAEVFKGTYNGQLVTVKSLLPQTRRNVECVTEFCSEAKMLTTMDHPRVVQLVGVAWDSRTDVCIVSEYLDGGDLRGLLDSFLELRHPVGFDYDKVKIALHVAHALTYLHSLEPPVIHRNLKSKNVLLTYELDAKLTDFGISREQMDSTMTAGVGSALWMAPEVVMGHRYDEKADVFSFGVLLSELDVHTLPYAHADAQSNSRHKMPESLILQQMVAGNLQVQFSQSGSGSAQTLGRACVAVDPDQRPTAAELLYKLHTILTREM